MIRQLRRFGLDREGSIVVEFALVFPLLLLGIMAIFQISLVFIAGQHLENATAELGRFVRTGQAQGLKLDQAAFRERLCNVLGPLLTCGEGNLLVDVQTLPDFGSVPLGWPIDDEGKFEGEGAYQPGQAGDIVVVRTFYQFPVWLPMIGETFSNLPNGNRLLSSAAAFRNEPF